jgi:hypothetical protein
VGPTYAAPLHLALWRTTKATHCARVLALFWSRRATCKSAGQASPDDGDALALTFAQPVASAEVEEADEEEAFGRYTGSSSSGWMR